MIFPALSMVAALILSMLEPPKKVDAERIRSSSKTAMNTAEELLLKQLVHTLSYVSPTIGSPDEYVMPARTALLPKVVSPV